MSRHEARGAWQRAAHAPFTDQRYSRVHSLHFDGGAVVAASASPHVVPVPMSDPTAVDPEELFVAALASCHMLWFLSLAARRGFVVERYDDAAIGSLVPGSDGRLAMTDVVLRPSVSFHGPAAPDAAALHALHDAAHHACFLAASVRCAISVEPVV